MEDFLIFSLLSLLFFFFAIKFMLPTRTKYKNLPPSPFALPILGHAHLLKPPFNQTFQTLSEKFGPIFSLGIGSRLVVIVTSLPAAEECFTKNDVVFANRPPSTTGDYLGYGRTTLGISSYGDHWRTLRRNIIYELLSTTQLNATLEFRREAVKNFMRKLYGISRHGFAKVELKNMFLEMTLNNLMKITMSRLCSAEEVRKFRMINDEFFSLAVPFYLGDYFPILKLFDTNGYIKRVKQLRRKFDIFFQSFIDEQRNCPVTKDNVMAHMLSLQKKHPEHFTDQIIIGQLQSILMAGSDTTALTMEWAMTYLLTHPQVLEKLKVEVDAKLDPNKLVDESDVSNLNYLKNIILETERLQPAAPLLVGHLSSDYCTLGGYDIPSETTLLVNAWAIHRDPTLWDDPSTFKPERHDEQGKGGERSASSKLITFGLGRRACPGTNLAQRMLGLGLASMIQCFEWKKVDDKDIDMTAGIGLTAPKLIPLEAMCKPRPIAHKLFSEEK